MRGKIQIPDVVVLAAVSIATLALAPVFYDLINMLSEDAGPLSTLMLQLVIPLIFLGLVISAGVSARRRV